MLNKITSAQHVLADDDLFTEILLLLPIKSLIRFKSVSKRWLFLITDTHFTVRRNPDPCYISGLFYHSSNINFLYWNEFTESYKLDLEFITLKKDKNPIDDSHLDSINVPNLSGIKVINSSHGLFLCLGYNETKHEGGYHVLNPTTKQFVTLPNPHLEGLEGVHLAFDPSKSHHYKVVCVWSTHVCISTNPSQWEHYFQIEIYSSQTKTWRASGDKFTTIAPHTIFRDGVYWNGAINWLNAWSSLYFNVDEEHLGNMPNVPIPDGKLWYNAQHLFFGESRGHLHFAEIYDPTTQFNVYELKRDYSEWFVKYRVDLTTIANDFPEIEVINGNWYGSYALLSIVRRDDDYGYDEGSYIVLHIPGKFVIHDLLDKGYKIIYEYEGSQPTSNAGYELTVHPYIESFCSLV